MTRAQIDRINQKCERAKASLDFYRSPGTTWEVHYSGWQLDSGHRARLKLKRRQEHA